LTDSGSTFAHLGFAGLKPISPTAALAYCQQAHLMTALVDQEMKNRSDLGYLLGGNPLQVMFTNHNNHALFIAAVLQLSDYQLLAQILPWVYRSYHARGFQYAYFIFELNAWKNALTHYLDVDCATEISVIYDWMIAQHEHIIGLAENFSLLPTEERSPEREQQIQFLTTCLLKGDRKASREWLEALLLKAELSLTEIYLELFQPAMQQIGLLWEEAKISVAQEHLASALVSRLMVLLYANQDTPILSRGKAVIATGPNELHEMGAWMLSDLLEQDGWDTRYLGANTPVEDFLLLLRQEKPDIIALSVTIPFNLNQVADLIGLIRQQEQRPQPRIMLGGLALNYHELLWEKLGADGYARNAYEAVALAAQWGES
jgi:MerR family transcriptional regulator, light-induced transcriptional regulator